MNLSTQFSGRGTWGGTHTHADNILFFSKKNDTSQGRTLPAAFGIPGKAGLPYQAEQVWCKVGTRGRSVSRWIPNVKAHPKPWEMRQDIKATVPGGRTRMRMTGRGRAPGERKQVGVLQSRRVLWIMGDNVTADFCRGSQWCWVSFFMDSRTHVSSSSSSSSFFFFFYTAINNTLFPCYLKSKNNSPVFLELLSRNDLG